MRAEQISTQILGVTPSRRGQGEVLYGRVTDQVRSLELLLVALSCIHYTPLFQLAQAWKDDVLRLGYLPTLPTRITQIDEILDNWICEEGKKIYFIYPSNYVNSEAIGYISTKKMSEKKLWITYANISAEDKRNKGYILAALRILICYLSEMHQEWELVTTVSDRNTASVAILQKCGFTLTRTEEDSPIAMGGKKIVAQLKLQMQ